MSYLLKTVEPLVENEVERKPKDYLFQQSTKRSAINKSILASNRCIKQ